MPKTIGKKCNNAAQGPYSKGPSSKLGNSIFKMNTDIGQHVLKNPGIANAIVEKAGLRQSDTVLEIGPGSGNLTTKILERAKKVIAIELDPRMAAEVTKRFQGKPEQRRLDVLLGDAIKTEFPYHDVCLANTPYTISSPLTFKLLALNPAPRVCILMFQREFAARLTARPGDSFYSRLSVNAQMYAKIDHIMKVGRNNFKPPPAVESSVVRLVPKYPRPQVEFAEFDGLLRICFVRKNKVLRGNFLGTSSVMDLLEANYRTWCAQTGVELDDRPLEEGEEVVVEEVDGGGAMGGQLWGEKEEEMEWTGFGDKEDEDHDMNEDVIPDFFRNEADAKFREATAVKKTSQKKKSRVALLVREKVRRVLEDKTGLADKRARMLDQTDFLLLLFQFNLEGLRFS